MQITTYVCDNLDVRFTMIVVQLRHCELLLPKNSLYRLAGHVQTSLA
jgi:hypothetical protein